MFRLTIESVEKEGTQPSVNIFQITFSREFMSRLIVAKQRAVSSSLPPKQDKPTARSNKIDISLVFIYLLMFNEATTIAQRPTAIKCIVHSSLRPFSTIQVKVC